MSAKAMVFGIMVLSGAVRTANPASAGRMLVILALFALPGAVAGLVYSARVIWRRAQPKAGTAPGVG
jgi:hypothetical protein